MTEHLKTLPKKVFQKCLQHRGINVTIKINLNLKTSTLFVIQLLSVFRPLSIPRYVRIIIKQVLRSCRVHSKRDALLAHSRVSGHSMIYHSSHSCRAYLGRTSTDFQGSQGISSTVSTYKFSQALAICYRVNEILVSQVFQEIVVANGYKLGSVSIHEFQDIT